MDLKYNFNLCSYIMLFYFTIAMGCSSMNNNHNSNHEIKCDEENRIKAELN